MGWNPLFVEKKAADRGILRGLQTADASKSSMDNLQKQNVIQIAKKEKRTEIILVRGLLLD